MYNRKQQQIILWVLTAFMILNVAVSAYIQVEKEAMLHGESDDVCFASTGPEGNCADVQLSEYGELLGVGVPIWGIVLFSFMALMLGSIAYSLGHRYPITSEQDISRTIKFAGFSFIVACIGSIYFISLQLFIIDAICKYCMIIDSLTLVSAAMYFATFKKGVDFYGL